MTAREIRITLNGREEILRVTPGELLIHVLRDRLGLTGAKYGCGVAECGACTVIVDGQPALSCSILAVTMDGKTVTTIEGLGQEGLDPVQEAFVEHTALQCGYCTPGLVLTARSLLDENPAPTEDEIREYIRGNICRCTGYNQVVAAIKSCAR